MSNRTLVWIAGAALGLALLLMVLSAVLMPLTLVDGPTAQPFMPHVFWPAVWPFMLLMMLGMLLFWVTVIVGLVLLVRWISRPVEGRPEYEDALAILRERYARGEIDREEFEGRRSDLERSN